MAKKIRFVNIHMKVCVSVCSYGESKPLPRIKTQEKSGKKATHTHTHIARNMVNGKSERKFGLVWIGFGAHMSCVLEFMYTVEHIESNSKIDFDWHP